MPHCIKLGVETSRIGEIWAESTFYHNWPSSECIYTEHFETGLYLCCHLVTAFVIHSFHQICSAIDLVCVLILAASKVRRQDTNPP